MNTTGDITRREWLVGAAATAVWGGLAQPASAGAAKPIKPKLVAAVVTTYFKGSHADVLIGKILEGAAAFWTERLHRGFKSKRS